MIRRVYKTTPWHLYRRATRSDASTLAYLRVIGPAAPATAQTLAFDDSLAP